jgi:hypothetical protein
VIAGIVFLANNPDKMGKYHDTVWAADPKVLSEPPFNLPHYETVPMSEAPQPKTDIAAAQRDVAAEPACVCSERHLRSAMRGRHAETS